MQRRLLRLMGVGLLALCLQHSPGRAASGGSRDSNGQDRGVGSHANPQAAFAKGQAALQSGDLDSAERNFRAVIATDPGAGAAYANLGVIAMRRKQWERALNLFEKAEKLEPSMSGIRLNIGLVQYRRGNYAEAIAPLSTVVREQPDSRQAHYLLGLCYLFTEHYSDAVATLEPLWPEMSSDVMYLYVLDIAAHNSGLKTLDEKTLGRLLEVGSDTAQFHLILGKAHLNREETDKAIQELERAAATNSNLALVHFSLGAAMMRAGNDKHAEAEFRKDIAIEPDLPDNYEQLGVICARQQRNDEAEKFFREALRRDPKRPAALVGLAKLYLQEQKYKEAMTAVDAALQLAPNSQSVHFLRGQALARLGRQEEARAELATAQQMMNSDLEKHRKTLGDDRVPNPELTQQEP